MRVNANIASLQAYNNLSLANARVSKSSDKLSSGVRIRRAGDDPAGLAISKKIRAQAEGAEEASKNATNGISLIQTADGALNEVHNMLQRMRELAVYAANDTQDTSDREIIQQEIEQLKEEIDATSLKTEYNQIKVLNGDAKSLTIHVGPNMDQGIFVGIDPIKIATLGGPEFPNAPNPGDKVVEDIDVTSHTSAGEAIKIADIAISQISNMRSELGAVQNRMEHTILALDASSQNSYQSLSRIADTDMAKEMTDYTKDTVIYQAGISILAQANQRPQAVLQLLQ